MQIGMIGLGRMGANMTRRLMRGGHTCVGYDLNQEAVRRIEADGATGAASLEEFITKLERPRVCWVMLPAAFVDGMLNQLSALLAPGDIIVDGGNSYYHDDIRRAGELAARGLHYVDVGVSGGVWGAERGYCLMIGGEKAIVQHLDPIFATLAPGSGSTPRTPGRESVAGTAEQGYLHCGANGAGHFVKMVHAEGLNVLQHADVGKRQHSVDAETTPMEHPEHYQYSFNLADVAEVWRRGSVISSWLLDLTAQKLLEDPELIAYSGHVSDSGEGRWTVKAAIDEAVPLPVISAALYARFSSRGEDDYADKLLSAMRAAFGGHAEKKPGEAGGR
jgi:6-phosphogluconate dehydrogenase